MVDSGIKLSPDCLDKYFAMKKSNSDIAFITYTIKDKFVVTDLVVMNSELDGMMEEIKEANFPVMPFEPATIACLRYVLLKGDKPPRYATCLLKYNEATGVKDKVTFITWCPDDAPVKQRMLISSSKDAVKKKLEGLQFTVTANDEDEISYKEMAISASKGAAKFS